MKKMMAVVFAMLLGASMVAAQEQGQGTVNTMSNDPEQNQRRTGNMGTTTGQPNDVSPTQGHDATGVPMPQTMTGSDSNGDLNQKGPGTSKKNSKSQKKHKASTSSTTGSEKQQ